ncbi:unnamed protein product [Rotaria sp. Silwood2]|nr:unnamed protein product [Rotaria sp. Silwood2]CAF4197006.1 unnamed protein product [Rotaria sp. Silwood2]
MYFTIFHFVISLVGGIIRGRVLLDGNENKTVQIPTGSILTIYFQDTSIPDMPARDIKVVQLSNLVDFPINYQMEISNDLPPIFSYSLSARITNGNTLLFITTQRTSVPIKNPSPITIDIPVTNVNQGLQNIPAPLPFKNIGQYSWPEMLGKEGTYAVKYIKEKSGLTNVFTVLENSPITTDFQPDRVRVFVNGNGIVIRIPYIQ